LLYKLFLAVYDGKERRSVRKPDNNWDIGKLFPDQNCLSSGY